MERSERGEDERKATERKEAQEPSAGRSDLERGEDAISRKVKEVARQTDRLADERKERKKILGWAESQAIRGGVEFLSTVYYYTTYSVVSTPYTPVLLDDHPLETAVSSQTMNKSTDLPPKY